jgi:OmpW family
LLLKRAWGRLAHLASTICAIRSHNPIVKSVRQLSPALLFQCYFNAPTAKLRPFVGVGVSYNWFSDVQLDPNFIQSTQNNLGAVLAAGAGKPGQTQVSGKASWAPVFSVGLAYSFTDHWGLVASVTYIPLKTTSSVIVKAADGMELGVSSAELKADPIHFLPGPLVQVLSSAASASSRYPRDKAGCHAWGQPALCFLGHNESGREITGKKKPA